MGERTELGITIAATGLAAYVGYKTQGLVGSEISAVVPAYVSGLFAMREENLITVTEGATDLAGMDGAHLVAWIKEDERHAVFFTEALEAAWSILDRHRLRTLSYVLADGFQDDASLDVDQLVIKALRELDAPHIRVLGLVARLGRVDREEVRKNLPELSDGLDAIFAALERTGCLVSMMFPSEGAQPLAMRQFGATCLQFLHKANQS
jgi:hypothetical protein